MAAKNWTLKEAVKVIVDGTNTEAMQELGKRFPLTSLAIAKMGNNEGANALFGAMPDHMTMLKMERSLKEGVEESDEDQDEEVEDVEAGAGEEDLSSMSAKELMKLCDKRGIKVPHYGKNKQFYLDALAGGSTTPTEAEEEEADETEEKAEGPAYEEMTAMELYKLCKKRKIKTEPKQKAAVYIKLLKAADAAEDEANGDTDEDWGDEEEAPAPTKETGKATKATSGKTTKSASKAKKEETADEDDDWDI